MNPSDITAYLDRLCIESKIKGIELIATGRTDRANNSGCLFIASTHSYGYVSEYGDTPEEAIAKVRAQLKTPAQLAADKRDEAQKLILEAAVLDQESAETPVPSPATEADPVNAEGAS